MIREYFNSHSGRRNILPTLLLIGPLFKKKKEETQEEVVKDPIEELIVDAESLGIKCPQCGGTDLTVCKDNSGFCNSCKTAFVDIMAESEKR